MLSLVTTLARSGARVLVDDGGELGQLRRRLERLRAERFLRHELRLLRRHGLLGVDHIHQLRHHGMVPWGCPRAAAQKKVETNFFTASWLSILSEREAQKSLFQQSIGTACHLAAAASSWLVARSFASPPTFWLERRAPNLCAADLMSLFGGYDKTTGSSSTPSAPPAPPAHDPPLIKRLRSAGSIVKSESSSSSSGIEHLLPKEDDEPSFVHKQSSGLAPIFKEASVNPRKKHKQQHDDDFLETDDHDYIVDHCFVLSEQLRPRSSARARHASLPRTTSPSRPAPSALSPACCFSAQAISIRSRSRSASSSTKNTAGTRRRVVLYFIF